MMDQGIIAGPRLGTIHQTESSSNVTINQQPVFSTDSKHGLLFKNADSEIPMSAMSNHSVYSCSETPANSAPHVFHSNHNVYRCGCCWNLYTTICELHNHLQNHDFGGSYVYNSLIKTAFPKYDSVCKSVQTEDDNLHPAVYGQLDSEQYGDTNDDDVDMEFSVINIKTEPENIDVLPEGRNMITGHYDMEYVQNDQAGSTLSHPKLIKYEDSAGLNVVEILSDRDNCKNMKHTLDIEGCDSDVKADFESVDDYDAAGVQNQDNRNIFNYTKQIKYEASVGVNVVDILPGRDECSNMEHTIDIVGGDSDVKADFEIWNLPDSSFTEPGNIDLLPKGKNIITGNYVSGSTLGNPQQIKYEDSAGMTVVEILPDRDMCSNLKRDLNTEGGDLDVMSDFEKLNLPDSSFTKSNCNNLVGRSGKVKAKTKTLKTRSKSKKTIAKSASCSLEERDINWSEPVILEVEQAELDSIQIQVENPFEQLQKHIHIHKCNQCEKEFHNKIKLINHLKSQHSKKRKNKNPYYTFCKVCQTGFFEESVFEGHDCHPVSLKCLDCGKEFLSNTTLRTHIIAEHEPFKCELCDKVLCSQMSLTNHTMMHRGEKPILCSVCDKPFRTKANLKKHMPVHTGVKSAVCEYCGKGFYHRNMLLQHVKQCRGDKPYKCTECEMAFAFKHFLVKHMRTHTGEKPYVCEVCGVAFARGDEYRHHKYVHTGEKPYPCSMCDMAFSRFNSRQRHERTHTHNRPYKCATCGKAFTSSWNHKVHMRQHSGEKPYSCEVCGLGFTHNVTRKAHMKTHVI